MTPAARCATSDSALLAQIHARSAAVPPLRALGRPFVPPPADDPPRVLRIDPEDGARGVLRDAAVVVTVSHALEPISVGPRTLRITCEGEPVDGRLALSPDGRIVIWTPTLPLRAGAEHTVEVSGLLDRRGRDVRPHRSLFRSGLHGLDDLLEKSG